MDSQSKVYSIAKGLSKSVISAAVFGLTLAGAIIATNPDWNNVTIVELLTKNLTQLLGTMTVGGLITLIINYLKVKASSV